MLNTNQLNEPELYNNTLFIHNVTECVHKYIEIVTEFVEFTHNNDINIKSHYKQYIITKGLESMQHIFLFLLLYTCNINLTIYNVQKAFYYYIEFIEQIQNEEQFFIKFNIKDAILFIYKKTIYEVNSDYIRNYKATYETKSTIEQIKFCLDDINIFLSNFIHDLQIYYNNNIALKNITIQITKLLKHYVSNLTKKNKTTKLLENYTKIKSSKKAYNVEDIIEACIMTL